jgi:hypothetical protein
MTKMTHRTNLTIVVKVVDLDTSRIYSPNHMVGMDKISFNEACKLKCFEVRPTSFVPFQHLKFLVHYANNLDRLFLHNILIKITIFSI